MRDAWMRTWKDLRQPTKCRLEKFDSTRDIGMHLGTEFAVRFKTVAEHMTSLRLAICPNVEKHLP